MHTEHLQNVHVGWVAGGWLVAVAVTSLALLVLASVQLFGSSPETDTIWIVLAVGAGFFVGGFFIGFRALEAAPILHGIAIGLASLVAWFLVNLLLGLPLRRAEWEALTPTLTAAVLLEQMLAAVVGAWAGYRIALRGEIIE